MDCDVVVGGGVLNVSVRMGVVAVESRWAWEYVVSIVWSGSGDVGVLLLLVEIVAMDRMRKGC